jgi:hypothetical protein
MNIQRRNVSSERMLILFSNTTDLFSVAVFKDFPQTILCHKIEGKTRAIFVRHFKWF